MASAIANICLTEDDVRNAILAKVGLPSNEYKLQQVAIKPIGVGYGLMGEINRASLTWSKPHAQIPDSIVIKVPNSSVLGDHLASMKDQDAKAAAFDQLQFVLTAHKTECAFYQLFLTSEPPMLMPRPYYTRLISEDAKTPGVIVMEDLSNDSALVSLIDGLRLNQVFSAVEVLAQLHAWCFKNQSTWKPLFPLNKPFFGQIANMMKNSCGPLKQLRPGMYDEVLAKMAPCFEQEFVMKTILTYETLGMPPILVQGDFWTSNMLFHADANETNKAGDKLKAMFDFQTMHPGTITEDIVRLMTASFSSQLRRKHEKDVLQHYYDTLVKLMGPEVPFGFDAVCKAYKLVYPYAASIVVIQVPITMASVEVKGRKDEKERSDIFIARAKAVFDDMVLMLENNYPSI